MFFLFYSDQTNSFAEKKIKPFKDNKTHLIAFSDDGKLFVALNKSNSQIAVFESKDLTPLQVFHLQNKYLAILLSNKIQHVFVIKQFLFLFFLEDFSFRLTDTSKVVQNQFFMKTFISHEIKLGSDLWVLEKNQHTCPVVFSHIKYYDEATDSLDLVTLTIFHLDGKAYKLQYKARLDQSLEVSMLKQWYSETSGDFEVEEGFIRI